MIARAAVFARLKGSHRIVSELQPHYEKALLDVETEMEALLVVDAYDQRSAGIPSIYDIDIVGVWPEEVRTPGATTLLQDCRDLTGDDSLRALGVFLLLPSPEDVRMVEAIVEPNGINRLLAPVDDLAAFRLKAAAWMMRFAALSQGITLSDRTDGGAVSIDDDPLLHRPDYFLGNL